MNLSKTKVKFVSQGKNYIINVFKLVKVEILILSYVSKFTSEF